MSVLASIILILSVFVKNSCGAVRPVVTFTPNWETVYEGDKVTLSCDVESTAQYNYYYWYQNHKYSEEHGQKFIITSAEEKDSGEYKCWAGGDYSLPARLLVISKGSAERPVVTFTPNWRKIFTGETVTITCDAGSRAQGTQQYYWYKDDKKREHERERVIKITSAGLWHSAYYQCSAGTGDRSLPVRLEVSAVSDHLLLQAPPSIYEGHPLSLRCHSRAKYTDKGVTVFHIEDKTIQSNNNPFLFIPNVNTTMTGMYRCAKYVGRNNRTDEAFISVQALFDTPQLTTNQSPVTEGDEMTLTCATRRNPARSTTELQFAFYRGWLNVQEFRVSATYSVLSAQLVHSGDYICEVRTTNGSVRKRSDVLSIQVQEPFSYPEIKMDPANTITEGADMTLTCVTTIRPGYTGKPQYAFYRDGQNVQEFGVSATYSVQSAQLVHSGYYTCDVRTPSRSVWKRSNGLSIRIEEPFSHPEIKMDPANTITEGADMTLTCVTTIRPGYTGKPQYAFYRDGQNVQEFGVSATYSVQSAQLVHSGYYTCDVKTSSGSVRERSNGLSIPIEAVAVNEPKLQLLPEEVSFGDEVGLLCESRKGSLPIHYRYYHNGTLIGNITVHDKMAEAELRLTITSLTMAGPYYCDSGNDFFSQQLQSNTFTLFVMAPVADVTIARDTEGEGFVLGSPVTLTCSVQRGSSPSLLWLHNDEVVERDSEAYQLRDSGAVLYIGSLTRHHTGTYRCNATIALPTSTTFSVLSNIQSINVLGLGLADGNILWLILGTLLLVCIILTTLLFMYRHKLAPLFVSCHRKQPTTDVTFEKAQTRAKHRPITKDAHKSGATDHDPGDYSNITPMESPTDEDVCYSYIDIKGLQASPVTAKDYDDVSILYSVVKCSGDTLKTQTTEETSDSTTIYQNFTKQH